MPLPLPIVLPLPPFLPHFMLLPPSVLSLPSFAPPQEKKPKEATKVITAEQLKALIGEKVKPVPGECQSKQVLVVSMPTLP